MSGTAERVRADAQRALFAYDENIRSARARFTIDPKARDEATIVGLADVLAPLLSEYEAQAKDAVQAESREGELRKRIVAQAKRIEGLEAGLRHMRRWASGLRSGLSEEQCLGAVTRMCDDALAAQADSTGTKTEES